MLMKSFSVFMEDIATAKAEADAREKRSTDLTQASRKKTKTKRKILSKLFWSQQKKAEELKKRRENQRQNARAKAAQTSHNVTQAVKGTAKLGSKIVKAVANRRKPQPNS